MPLYFYRNYKIFFEKAMRMFHFSITKGLLFFVFITVINVAHVDAAQVPKALAERSISVSWQETREDRVPPDGEWREIHSYRTSVVYISSAGRVFRRENAVNMGYGHRRGGRRLEGSLDANVNGGVGFSGNSMTIIAQAAQGSAARRTIIVFDQDFRSCTATIITGKTGETASFMQHAIARGGLIEVRSVQTSSVTCEIVDGNKLQ